MCWCENEQNKDYYYCDRGTGGGEYMPVYPTRRIIRL